MSANGYAQTFGITIKYADVGSSPTTELVAGNLKAVPQLPKLAGTTYKTTRINQAADIDQKAPGTADPGQLKLTIGFVKADVTTVYGLFQVLKSMLVTFSDGSTLAFDGFLNEIEPKGESNNEVTLDLTFEVSGGHTFTAAA